MNFLVKNGCVRLTHAYFYIIFSLSYHVCFVINDDTLNVIKIIVIFFTVMAYMEIFGNCTQNNNEFLRYSVPAYNLTHTAEQIATHNFTSTSSITHSQTMTMSSPAHQNNHKPTIPSPLATSPGIVVVHGKPPALPPKSVRQNSLTHREVPTPPSSPKPPVSVQSNNTPVVASSASPVLKISPVRLSHESCDDDRAGYEHLCDATTNSISNNTNNHQNNNNNQSLSPNNSNVVVVTNNSTSPSPTSPSIAKVTVSDADDEEVVLRRNNPREKVLICFF